MSSSFVYCERKIMASGFIVGSKNKHTGEMSIAPRPMIHPTVQDAETEAKRLAVIDTHKKFVVLKIGRVFQSVEVEETVL